MKKILSFILFFLSLIAFLRVEAQDTQIEIEQDSISEADKILYKEVKEYDPNRAALLSAALPGLGQIYTKKYWKLPLVYGGAVGIVMYYQFANERYIFYKTRYQELTANIPAGTGTGGTTGITGSSPVDRNINGARTGERYYRRNRDLAIIMGALFYTMVIVDAYVDAHLKGFEVSDQLTISVRPLIGTSYSYNPNLGLKLNLNIR